MVADEATSGHVTRVRDGGNGVEVKRAKILAERGVPDNTPRHCCTVSIQWHRIWAQHIDIDCCSRVLLGAEYGVKEILEGQSRDDTVFYEDRRGHHCVQLDSAVDCSASCSTWN